MMKWTMHKCTNDLNYISLYGARKMDTSDRFGTVLRMSCKKMFFLFLLVSIVSIIDCSRHPRDSCGLH